MGDAVALIRHNIEDPSLAFQDATMDAVVTLAAIEVSCNSSLCAIAHKMSRSTARETLA